MSKMKKIYENVKNKIQSNKKTAIIVSSTLVLLLFSIAVISINNNKQKDLTPAAFKTKEYTYLPKKAQNYIKDVYERTGQIIKTEKNKEKGEPYLNPEYVDYLMNKTDTKYGYVPTPMIADYDLPKTKTGDSLPSKYDSRNVDGKNYVTSVKDQEETELCWDFALTSALETKILKENMYSGTDEIDLSERQIDYARVNPHVGVDIEKNPFYRQIGDLNEELAGPANVYAYFSAVSQGISPVVESKWTPGFNTNGKHSPELVWNTENLAYDVDESYFIAFPPTAVPTEHFINFFKTLIMENGSLTVAIPVAEDADIYYSATDRLFYRAPNGPAVNHKIVIVGWDDTYEKNICVASDGSISAAQNSSCGSGKTLTHIKGAWITKNSYGTESMYFPNPYVAYQSAGGIYESINTVSTKNWDNIYTGEIEKSEQSFNKLKTKEKINKIRFEADSVDTTASIYVSTTGNDSDYQLVGTKNINFMGLYTLDISDKNIVLDNTKFKVKVELGEGMVDNPGITVMTDNVDTAVEINIDNAKYDPDENYGSLVNKTNGVLLNGVSRNLNRINSPYIYYTVTNAAGEDVTNKFTFDRNYEVSNYINTIVGFNDDVADGNYTVIVKNYDGNEFDEFNLNINRVPDTVPVTGVAFDVDKIKLSVQVDNVYLLKTTISPSNASNKNVTYVSSDKSVATVDQNGKITAVGVGTATISAISVSGAKTATCEVTVDDLLVPGDMNGDKKVNISDVARLYRHVKGINTITNPRRIKCGLLVSETSPAMADVEELYRRVKAGE